MDGRMWEEGLHNTDKTSVNFILFINFMETWRWNTQLLQTSLRLLCSWFWWLQSIKSSAWVYDLRFKVNSRISHRRGLFIWRWALGNVLVLVMVQPQKHSAVSGQNKGMRQIYSKNTWVLSLVSAVCIQTKYIQSDYRILQHAARVRCCVQGRKLTAATLFFLKHILHFTSRLLQTIKVEQFPLKRLLERFL